MQPLPNNQDILAQQQAALQNQLYLLQMTSFQQLLGNPQQQQLPQYYILGQLHTQWSQTIQPQAYLQPQAHLQQIQVATVNTTTESVGRYSGHDSAGNKKALLAIVDHRNTLLSTSGLKLSEPEEAFLNYNRGLVSNLARGVGVKIESGRKITGSQNHMNQGTAICHKISDKSIRDNIANSASNHPHLLKYLTGMIEYINPKYIPTDHAPTSGIYVEVVKDAYNNAMNSYSNLEQASIPDDILRYAHQIGGYVANSPVNLFIGESVTNSEIQANLDQNTYSNRYQPPILTRTLTPRTNRSDIYKETSSLVLKDTGVPKSSSLN